ncbi:MAG: chromosome partitioning protein ParA, partial [Paramuribaculum sp.]|nr:chromosome partitioning protein ParA [Paramuribaculum sp.]
MPTAISKYQAKLTETLSNEDASVIDFAIKDDNVQRGDDFLSALIDIYNEKWVEQKAQMAVATSEFINERLNVIEKELGHVDDDIATFKGEHLVPDVAAASELYMANANENTKQQLGVMTQMEITRFLIDYMQSPANKGKLLPGNLGIENQGIVAQITEYNNLQLERDQLLSTTGENSPLVKDRDNSLASIRAALASSLNTQLRMLGTQLAALERSDRKTNAKIASSPSQAKYLLSVERQQ